jgi:hypothetical protein
VVLIVAIADERVGGAAVSNRRALLVWGRSVLPAA